MKNTNHKSNKKLNNTGAAMIFALIVSVVLMVFCLSLLLVSYRLFATANQSVTDMQCKETARSVSQMLEKQITVSYDSYAAQEQAEKNSENDLWFFLRYNLFHNSTWPYYNKKESISGHSKNSAGVCVPYSIKIEDDKFAGEDVTITMYWGSTKETLEGDDRAATVYVKVTVNKAQSQYNLTSVYDLNIMTYTDGVNATEQSQASYNPCNYTIDANEQWIFVLRERS